MPVHTEKGNLIQKSSKYGVGKQMGNVIYVHQSAEDVIPPDLLHAAQEELPPDFIYTIVKYDSKNDNITFIYSPDWDFSDEPIVGDAILIRGDGTKREIKQKSSPQIYHHKWLFVRDDYGGFDSEESKNRSRKWTSLPNIQYNRIGYKNYWDREVVPLIEIVMKNKLLESYTEIDPAEREKANKSSRSSGAVGPQAITPRMVTQYVNDTGNKDIEILDFGAGKDAKHTYALRDLGLNVTAHDFYSNIKDDHHDPNALDKEYDIVFASNVLNVQGSESMLRRTLKDILKVLKKDGIFIANFPGSPRYYFENAQQIKKVLEDYFDLTVLYGTEGSKSSSPVWAMSKLPNQTTSYWE